MEASLTNINLVLQMKVVRFIRWKNSKVVFIIPTTYVLLESNSDVTRTELFLRKSRKTREKLCLETLLN